MFPLLLQQCVSLSCAVLSILSQRERTNCQALSESPLEVCLSTKRAVTIVGGPVTFELRWSSSFIVTKTGGWCGYHISEPTRLGKMSKLLRPSRHRSWKARLGNTGDSSCLELATEPSPPRSAAGSSAADAPPSGFPAAGLWEAPLDCSFDRRAEWALATARPPLSLATPGASCTSRTSSPLLCLHLSTACCVSPCVHTLRVVVQQCEHSAYAERSGITTHRRYWLRILQRTKFQILTAQNKPIVVQLWYNTD